ncbi:MAG: Crp/Fnr family transcriptional regulator [Cyanobacteria bacterium J06635_15]
MTSLQNSQLKLSRQLLQQLPQQLVPVPKAAFKRRETLPLKSQTVWKIHDGFVRIITWDDEGCVIPMSFWGPGSLIGTELILMHPYEVECITPVTAEKLTNQPKLPSTMLVDQTQQALALLRIVHCRRVDCRLLQFICWLANRYGQSVPGGHLIPFKITHQELADAIGTTRVTITRFLKQFELEGLLQWSVKSQVIYEPTLSRIHMGLVPTSAGNFDKNEAFPSHVKSPSQSY